MDSFQKFMMIQCAKIAVSTILVEAAGILLGVTIAEQSAKEVDNSRIESDT